MRCLQLPEKSALNVELNTELQISQGTSPVVTQVEERLLEKSVTVIITNARKPRFSRGKGWRRSEELQDEGRDIIVIIKTSTSMP